MQAAERSLTELKEFASQLKALPNIQRHIGLAEAVNKVINTPAFRSRVSAEQSILDGQSADAAAEAIEVGHSMNRAVRIHLQHYCVNTTTDIGGEGWCGSVLAHSTTFSAILCNEGKNNSITQTFLSLEIVALCTRGGMMLTGGLQADTGLLQQTAVL